MKKLIPILVYILFIISLPFDTLSAKGKIGLNIKVLAGAGISEYGSAGASEVMKTNLSVPQITSGISYQISKRTPLELGIFYHYNKYKRPYKISGTEDMKVIHHKIKIDSSQLSLEILYTFPAIVATKPYIALDFFPYSKIHMNTTEYHKFKINKSFLALSGTIGLKYRVSKSFNIFTQALYQHIFKKEITYTVKKAYMDGGGSTYDEKHKVDVGFTNINIMLGFGLFF